MKAYLFDAVLLNNVVDFSRSILGLDIGFSLTEIFKDRRLCDS